MLIFSINLKKSKFDLSVMRISVTNNSATTVSNTCHSTAVLHNNQVCQANKHGRHCRIFPRIFRCIYGPNMGTLF